MPVNLLQNQLDFVNNLFRPILKFFVPDLNLTRTKKLSFINLIVFSFTIPFILGINDFAGYIPIFEYVNVFGFTLGVMLGHMLLTIGLFLLPKITVGIVKHPVVLIGGGLAFLGIGIFGFYEAVKIALSIIWAGEENRTLVTTLEKLRSTIELHPRTTYYTKPLTFCKR